MSLCISAGLTDGLYAGIDDPCGKHLGPHKWSKVPNIEILKAMKAFVSGACFLEKIELAWMVEMVRKADFI